MTTLRKWLNEFTTETGETPTQIVFGSEHGWGQGMWNGIKDGALVALADVPAAVLDTKFDDGFGGNESPNLCAWSKSWVIFSDNYDGAEHLLWVPRMPKAHQPIRPGGG